MTRFFAAFLTMALLAPCARADSAPLTRFEVRYAVIAHGVDIGEADYSFAIDANGYRGAATRRATGLIRSMVGASQDFSYASEGVFDGDRVRPRAYHHRGGRGHRVVEVSFNGDAINTHATPSMGMGHPPATEAQKAGAIDQVSLLLQILVAKGDPCQQSYKVFMDGRSRFDLTMRANGRQRVAIANFHGDAQRCSVQFSPIAGFSDPQDPAVLTFLFAPMNGYSAPLSIEMPTDGLGVVRLEARRLSIAGARQTQ